MLRFCSVFWIKFAQFLLCFHYWEHCNLSGLQVIAAVSSVKESYHNCQTLFALLQLDQLPNVKMTADLKADHLFLGMQGARARYPKQNFQLNCLDSLGNVIILNI